VVFWVVILFNDVVGYHCFREACYHHFWGEVNGVGKGGIDIGRECKRG